MKSECRAVIDVGTNSVKLLVAEVCRHQVKPLRNLSEATRLGQGLHEAGRLQAEAIARTAQVIAEFANAAKALRPISTRVVATSAAREAENREELLAAVKKLAELEVEVISGDQEAEWVYDGVSSDPKLHGNPLLIVDVGGGSTEVILGDESTVSYRKSFPIGALRLFELLKPVDPPSPADLAQCRTTLDDFLHWEVRPELEPALRAVRQRTPRLVGTGGTAAVLARIIAGKGDEPDDLDKATSLRTKQIRDTLELLWSTSLAQRLKMDGLPSKRADVVLTGSAVFEAFMTRFDFPQLTVSRRGLRHGVLLSRPRAGGNLLDPTSRDFGRSLRVVPPSNSTFGLPTTRERIAAQA
ncbi:MAG: hypothetical protein L0Z50_07795 [Verrucomicrobiales bacterium]|nr:hypothetical protein [Verrucomicrobiales bacterium]